MFKGYMWLCKNNKRRKGSKRSTSVPIIKTMDTRCPLPYIKKRERMKIAHVFLEKFQ